MSAETNAANMLGKPPLARMCGRGVDPIEHNLAGPRDRGGWLGVPALLGVGLLSGSNFG